MSYVYLTLDLVSASEETLEETAADLESKLAEIFELQPDENIETVSMPEWGHRQTYYAEEAPGPGSTILDETTDEDVGICAYRYKLYVNSNNAGGLPNLDNLLDATEKMTGVRLIVSYLYYDLEDIGEAGFMDIANGGIDDEDSVFFAENPTAFISLSRKWLGWEFPELHNGNRS